MNKNIRKFLVIKMTFAICYTGINGHSQVYCVDVDVDGDGSNLLLNIR